MRRIFRNQGLQIIEGPLRSIYVCLILLYHGTVCQRSAQNHLVDLGIHAELIAGSLLVFHSNSRSLFRFLIPFQIVDPVDEGGAQIHGIGAAASHITVRHFARGFRGRFCLRSRSFLTLSRLRLRCRRGLCRRAALSCACGRSASSQYGNNHCRCHQHCNKPFFVPHNFPPF